MTASLNSFGDSRECERIWGKRLAWCSHPMLLKRERERLASETNLTQIIWAFKLSVSNVISNAAVIESLLMTAPSAIHFGTISSRTLPHLRNHNGVRRGRFSIQCDRRSKRHVVLTDVPSQDQFRLAGPGRTISSSSGGISAKLESQIVFTPILSNNWRSYVSACRKVESITSSSSRGSLICSSSKI
jgi:hypothetical protein